MDGCERAIALVAMRFRWLAKARQNELGEWGQAKAQWWGSSSRGPSCLGAAIARVVRLEAVGQLGGRQRMRVGRHPE
eukprot:11167642-Lingulodinium_polyedra.AAC.1